MDPNGFTEIYFRQVFGTGIYSISLFVIGIIVIICWVVQHSVVNLSSVSLLLGTERWCYLLLNLYEKNIFICGFTDPLLFSRSRSFYQYFYGHISYMCVWMLISMSLYYIIIYMHYLKEEYFVSNNLYLFSNATIKCVYNLSFLCLILKLV